MRGGTAASFIGERGLRLKLRQLPSDPHAAPQALTYIQSCVVLLVWSFVTGAP